MHLSILGEHALLRCLFHKFMSVMHVPQTFTWTEQNQDELDVSLLNNTEHWGESF